MACQALGAVFILNCGSLPAETCSCVRTTPSPAREGGNTGPSSYPALVEGWRARPVESRIELIDLRPLAPYCLAPSTRRRPSDTAYGAARAASINYNPMVLPKGVEPSADPMLAARAAPYAVSLGRRLVEGAKQ